MRRFALAAFALALILAPRDARAVRFTLGVASDVTPVLVDPDRPADAGSPFRFGFRPVVEVEANHYLSFGAYAPFTVYRADGTGAASSGAESVFGITASGRYPILRATAPEEILAYGTLRGGFGTVDGRAGPYYGGALGAAFTWLETGRGLFAELNVAKLNVTRPGRSDVDRLTFGLSIGLIFRLGGEDWRIGSKSIGPEGSATP